jgi:hypothetical protein
MCCGRALLLLVLLLGGIVERHVEQVVAEEVLAELLGSGLCLLSSLGTLGQLTGITATAAEHSALTCDSLSHTHLLDLAALLSGLVSISSPTKACSLISFSSSPPALPLISASATASTFSSSVPSFLTLRRMMSVRRKTGWYLYPG